MLSFRSRVVLFWVTTRIILKALMLKQCISFLVLSSTAAALYLQALFLAPVSLNPPPPTNNQCALIGQITHTWASTAHSVFQVASS